MIHYTDERVTLHHGDCLDVLRDLPDNSVDAVVTDPPYALEFMGRGWDRYTPLEFEAWCEQWAAECLRVLKPGGHLLAFGGSRTWHRLAAGIEDAGFEMRDSIAWLYGSGFPKSLDVGKALDKAANAAPLWDDIRAHIREWRDRAGMTNPQLNAALGLATNGAGMARHWTSEVGGQHAIPSKDAWASLKALLGWPDCDLDAAYAAVKDGADRPVVGVRRNALSGWSMDGTSRFEDRDITAPATDLARQWHGWGTALKPAVENLVVAQKPPTLQARIGSHLDALEQACRRPLANDADRTSAPTRPASREVKTATAPAHAATPLADEPARPTPTGPAAGSFDQTATSASASAAETCSSIVTSWRHCWAALSEPTSTSTTATTSSTTTGLTTLWSCLSKITGPSTLLDPTSPDGLSRLARAADSLFAAAFLSWSATRTLTATEPATSPTPQHSQAADGSRQQPIVVARKPLSGTVAANVTTWGTGALNIDACRVATTDTLTGSGTPPLQYGGANSRPFHADAEPRGVTQNPAGRWPTNVVLTHSVSCGTVDQPGPCVDGCPVRELDAQSGTLTSGSGDRGSTARIGGIMGKDGQRFTPYERAGDSGGASRFFPTFRYEAKAPTIERPRVQRDDGTWEAHSTVKPLDLMRWLVRLVTPPGVSIPVCSKCGKDVHGMRADVQAASSRAEAVRTDMQAEAGRKAPSNAASTMPDLWSDHHGEDTDLLLGAVSGEGAAAAGNAVRGMRADVPAGSLEAEVLLEGVHRSSGNTSAQAVRVVRRGVSADGQQEQVLLADLCGSNRGDGETEGTATDGAGLRPGVRTGAPDGNANGLPPAAPKGNGGAPGEAARPRRGSASQKRNQDGQPGREPRGVTEAGSRPDTEAAAEADRVPTLRGNDGSLGTCADCGGALVPGTRPGVVLEPFAGSGTTAEACVIEGMHCIAIEREADYLPLIVARLSKPIELDLFGGVA